MRCLRMMLWVAVLAFFVTSASAVTTSNTVPFDLAVLVPCAADGAGEIVVGQGSLHVVGGLTVDEAGGVHAQLHLQPQGVKATGLVTGDVYRGSGLTRFTESFNAGGLPIVGTVITTFRLIGPGPGNNLKVHQTFHVTVNENGTVTADVENVAITCS